MIKSIRLLNWRSHKDSRFEFREGTNLLVGMMGAGKSSVLEAISFAFFGTFPALERRKLKLEDIVRLNEPRARAALEFEWEGALYRIERTIERSKKGASSDAELYRDDRLVDQGPTAVSAYLRNLTGVDYDLFTRAIYSEQNNIDYFLTLDPRGRKQEIDALLGLDRFEEARKNVVTVINTIRARRGALEGRFRPEALEQARNILAEREAELSSGQAKAKELAALADGLREALLRAESTFSGLRKKKELHEGLSKDRLRMETISFQLRKELEGKEVSAQALENAKRSLQEKRKLWDSLKAQLRDIDSRISASSKSIGSLAERLKRAQQAEKELEGARKELSGHLGEVTEAQLESRKTEIENETISLISEQKSLQSAIKENDELASRLKPGLAKCPFCESELGEEGIAHVLEEKSRMAAAQKQRLGSLDAMISERKRLSAGICASLKKAESLRSRAAMLENELAPGPEIERGLAGLSAKNAADVSLKDEAEKKLAGLNPEIQELSLEAGRMEELVGKQAQLSDAERKFAEAAARLSLLGFDERAYEAARQSAEQSRMGLERVISEKGALEKQLAVVDEMAKRLRGELGQMESVRKEVERDALLEAQLTLYRNALLETQTSLRANLAVAINAAMKEVWAIFYPYRNYPSVRLSVTEKDYLIEVLERESWKPLESVASGGERACAALALRVAMAVVLTPSLSWLILDEPTHNLDAEAVRLLSDTLQTRVPEVVKQTFVITHEEGLMGADFASTYRLSRDGSGTGPTKAERI